MLAYFPQPYPDELLYSILARCRAHLGLGSHKTFLAMVYQDQKVSAVVDLPSHLSKLAESMSIGRQVDPHVLIYQHTLFPLYAPFMTEQRRKLLIKSMLGDAGGSIHTRAGMAAGTIKPPRRLRVCSGCLQEMRAQYGEYYWARFWQVTGVDSCPKHNVMLVETVVPYRQVHKHEYIAVRPDLCPVVVVENRPAGASGLLEKYVRGVLDLPPGESPTYWQWTQFYRQVATEWDAINGKTHIQYGAIQDQLLNTWNRHKLDQFGLADLDSESSWLRSIFRRHRKSFSYLQHTLVWAAFKSETDVVGIMEEVRGIAKRRPRASGTSVGRGAVLKDQEIKRTLWLTALTGSGGREVKQARLDNPALYAWLYRNDRQWLAEINSSCRMKRGNNRITRWDLRDRSYVRLLIKIGRKGESQLNCPRRSRNWFLQQLPRRITVEKHLDELPLCRAFFDRYCETVDEYQIRRVTNCFIERLSIGEKLKRWQLERACGLDGSRLGALTRKFLRWIEQGGYEENLLQEHTPEQTANRNW